MFVKANRSQQIANRVVRFTDLKAWQSGHRVVLHIYKLTKAFPKNEQFGLVSQMRRAAVSITSNIAEGFGRESLKEKLHFYSIAHGSMTELENQMMICRDTDLVDINNYKQFEGQINEVGRIIIGLMKSTRQRLNITKPIY